MANINLQTTNKSQKSNTKPVYDLEDRTKQFAANCRQLVKKIKKTITNIEDCKQLTRSSGSVGANYIEANESLSKKDFKMRIKICRKEAKESAYWLELLDAAPELETTRAELADEATQLVKIMHSILEKSK